jgi:hypothetical protein
MTALARHDAAVVVEQSLARVFDPAVVARLREDSPLTSAGLTTADLVCVADAIAENAQVLGSACRLTDEDVADVATVADLIDAVQQRSAADDGEGSIA